MLLESVFHHGYKVYDCIGNPIMFVQKYDTVSKEISMLIPNGGETVLFESEPMQPTQPISVSFVLHGSYAVYPNGKRIQE